MSEKSGYLRWLKFWLPVYLYAGLIFLYSSLSYPPPLVPKIFMGDKLLHCIEYAILGLLIARAADNSANVALSRHFRIFAICAAILYGISDEFHQYFVPEREASVFDLLADGLGAFLGQLLWRG